MIFLNKPADFSPRMEVVSCFCEVGDKFLLLHRPSHKSQGDTWGVPAGKMEAEEQPLAAIVREIQEETSMKIEPTDIHYFQIVYVRYPEFDFIFYMFTTQLGQLPVVTINPAEHDEYRWVTSEEALTMPLILDFAECVEIYMKTTLQITSRT